MQDYCYCKIFLERNKLVVPKLFSFFLKSQSLCCMCSRTVAGVTCVKLEQFVAMQLESTKQALSSLSILRIKHLTNHP